jgi:hypothetical protein
MPPAMRGAAHFIGGDPQDGRMPKTVSCGWQEEEAIDTGFNAEISIKRPRSGSSAKLNSLIPTRFSLLIEIFSLLICVGNCPGSGCSTAVSRYEIKSPSSKWGNSL